MPVNDDVYLRVGATEQGQQVHYLANSSWDATEAFESLAQEAGVIIAAGLILLGWRALSAWQAEAEMPDEVNRVEISGDDEGD